MSSSRRLLASAARIVPGERLDVLIYALAQLPDEVRWTREHSIDAVIAGLRLGGLRSRQQAAAGSAAR
jgi:hypothetical protein